MVETIGCITATPSALEIHERSTALWREGDGGTLAQLTIDDEQHIPHSNIFDETQFA